MRAKIFHVLLFFFSLMLYGCVAENDEGRFFADGDVVCFKGGGPKGVVRSYFPGYSVWVDFYIEEEVPINTQIKPKEIFIQKTFPQSSLLPEKDCP